MTDKFQDFVRDPKRQLLYEKEWLAFGATELISSLMEKEGISKTELAKKMGRSKAYVTQLLNGSRNMTLHTFAEMAFAFGYRIQPQAVLLKSSEPRVEFPISYPTWSHLLEGTNSSCRADPTTLLFKPGEAVPRGKFANALAA